jgi:preprotein translocase subunit SecA
MGRVFRALGMTTGCIVAGPDPAVRREQYAADITYGTNNEFGFDYLRDNMAWQASDMVQRGHFYAIVDEVDSILIDEARTPLIISGRRRARRTAGSSSSRRSPRRLEAGVDYEVDEKKRTVGVLEPGIEKVEDYLGIDNLYESANTPLISFLNNSIKALALFKRDKDYVVMNGEVLIVDEHTGRILVGPPLQRGHPPGDRGEGGRAGQGREPDPRHRHAAELLPPLREALGHDRYRRDRGGRVHVDVQARRGRRSRRTGRWCASTSRPRLQERGVQVRAGRRGHRRAPPQGPARARRHHERREERVPLAAAREEGRPARGAERQEPRREAAIVAQAGRIGAVTVATNMAGRGTDIMLGGNAEFLAVAADARRGPQPVDTPDEYEAAWDGVFEPSRRGRGRRPTRSVDAGGLYVLGTERHESRRIDNQLRGRSGRQGDPARAGSTCR